MSNLINKRSIPTNILISYYPEDLVDLLVEFLTNLDMKVYRCDSFNDVAALEAPELSLAVVDITNCDSLVIHTIRMVKQMESERPIPILVTCDTPDTETIVKALNAGAIDYMIRPFSKLELSQRIRSLIAEASK